MTTALPSLSLPAYRPDIDGLRALAVLAVVVFHAFPEFLPGGFVGVDVFFVISGFLISTILFKSLDAGTFSFRTFYARRIRRIFPALLLVLAASCALGWLALLADEYRLLGKHVAAGAGFVSNFALLREAGYFDVSAETKPLLHLWSLGVEEQFYIVWPLLVWLAWRRRIGLFWLVALLAAISFALNLAGTWGDAASTFYSPHTRFWELLCGSLIAWFKRRDDGLRQSGSPVPEWISLLGVLLLGASFTLIDRRVDFPGAWALLPVLGTSLVIVAGAEARLNRVLFSARPAVWLGLISFPLYLWHWPLLSFARIAAGRVPDATVRVAALALAVGLAWATYRGVERPFRQGGRNRVKVIVLVALMLLVGGGGLSIYMSGGFEERASLRQLRALQRDLEFSPERSRGGLCDEAFSGAYCAYQGEAPFAVVLGDSHSPRIYDGLKRLYAERGRGIANVGTDACPPLLDVVSNNVPASFDPDCPARMSAAIRRILADASVHEVYLASRGPLYTTGSGFGESENFSWRLRRQGDAEATLSNAEVYRQALDETLAALLAAGKKVTFFHDVPELGFDIRSCVHARPLTLGQRHRDPCAIPLRDYRDRTAGFRALVDSVLQRYPSVRVIDLAAPLCDLKYCHGMIDGMLMYSDDDHPSARGAAYVIDKIRDAL